MCLLAGISYLKMTMQKRATNRHLIATQGFAFLFKYFRLAGGCISLEATYNIGRVREAMSPILVLCSLW